MSSILKLHVVLKARRGNIPLFLILAQAISAAMTAHASLFTTLSALITLLASQTADLATAQVGVKNRTVNTADRDAKRDLVATTLEALRVGVQGLCDANPEQAASLIQASAMKAAASAVRAKPMLAARLTAQSGVVKLEANATLLSTSRKKKTYTWQSTLDGKSFTTVGTTGYARFTVTGLMPLTTVGFRVCVTVGDDAPGPWTQIVDIIVH
jgi:hypothetical protein